MDNYSLFYLISNCAPLLCDRYGLSHKQALNVLARGLLFRNYNSLKYAYKVDKENPIFSEPNIRIEVPIEIPHNGFVFSEYCLREALSKYDIKISIEEARFLAAELDNVKNPIQGNIFTSRLDRIAAGLADVINNKATRLMTDWPLGIYSQHDGESIMFNKYGRRFIVNGLFWFQGISIHSSEFFITHKNLKEHIREILKLFVKIDNLYIEQSFIESSLVREVLKEFKPIQCCRDYKRDYPGLLIPSEAPMRSIKNFHSFHHVG